MANGQSSLPDDITFTPPAHDMSDVTFTPPSQTAAPTAAAAPPPQRGVVENLLGGIAEGAAKTVTGAGNLLATGAEKLTGQPAGSLHATFQDNREVPSTARDIGEAGENVAEFAAGEGVLTKLGKLSKVPEAYLALAEKYPKIAKILLSAGEGATVGGVQGAVKGAAEGKTEKGAEGGALGGGAGAGLGTAVLEAATPLAEAVAKTFGIGTEATKDAIKSARPGKRNYKFADDFLRAAPYMDEQNQTVPAKTIEDWADHTAQARRDLYAQKIQPLVDENAHEPLGGLNIANQIRANISDEMKSEDPAEAVKMEELANRFMPGPKFDLNMANAEAKLQYYNSKLASTGYWAKMPSERAALLKTNGEIAGYKAAADAIRDEFYGKLTQLAPGTDIASLKQDYGALRNVEDEIRGRINVSDRQSPISLKETIGLITGLGHGGPVGAAMAAIPVLDRFGNSPENLMSRAVQKAARPGEESAVSKAAQGAGRAVKAGGPTTAAVAGAAGGRIIFTASDGTKHSIPANPNALAHAKAIDPGLQIVQQ